MFYFRVGQELRICMNCLKKRNSEKRIIKGKVVFLYDHYFVIQCENYKESVGYDELNTGEAMILI